MKVLSAVALKVYHGDGGANVPSRHALCNELCIYIYIYILLVHIHIHMLVYACKYTGF